MVSDNAIQQTVHESSRLAGAKPFGQLDRFGNCYFRWRVRLEQNFIGSKPKDTAVDGSHPTQGPVLSNLLDHSVNRIEVAAYAGDEIERKLSQGGTAQALFDELAIPFLCGNGISVRFVKQL